MGQTIQAAIGFTLSFIIILSFIISGPILYYQTNTTAMAFHSYQIKSIQHSEIYYIDELYADDCSLSAVYTSPEKMHYLLSSFSDVFTLLFEGVKAL